MDVWEYIVVGLCDGLKCDVRVRVRVRVSLVSAEIAQNLMILSMLYRMGGRYFYMRQMKDALH